MGSNHLLKQQQAATMGGADRNTIMYQGERMSKMLRDSEETNF